MTLIRSYLAVRKQRETSGRTDAKGWKQSKVLEWSQLFLCFHGLRFGKSIVAKEWRLPYFLEVPICWAAWCHFQNQHVPIYLLFIGTDNSCVGTLAGQKRIGLCSFPCGLILVGVNVWCKMVVLCSSSVQAILLSQEMDHCYRCTKGKGSRKWWVWMEDWRLETWMEILGFISRSKFRPYFS
jgi:hypothetical protein